MKSEKEGIKSQASIFIILSIIMLVSVGSVYFLNQKYNKNPDSGFISQDYNNLKENILNCRQISAQKSLDFIGKRGGYFSKPEYSLEIENKSIPYYYINNSIAPKKQDIEKQLCLSYEQEFNDCIDKIDKKEFNVSYRGLNPACSIFPEKILFEISSNFRISQNKTSIIIKMKDFPLEYNSYLGNIINLSQYISESQNENSICITCIANNAGKYNLYVNSFSLKSFTNLFIISENITSGKPYYFLFLTKSTKQEEQENQPDFPIMPYGEL